MSDKATGNTLLFLPVLVFFFKRGFRTDGDEFDETKRGFCWEHAPSKKPLSGFTQLSPFKRFKLIVGSYFSGIYQICFPEKSHGQQLTSHLINSNWISDWIFSLIIWNKKLNIDEEVFRSNSFGSWWLCIVSI